MAFTKVGNAFANTVANDISIMLEHEKALIKQYEIAMKENKKTELITLRTKINGLHESIDAYFTSNVENFFNTENEEELKLQKEIEDAINNQHAKMNDIKELSNDVEHKHKAVRKESAPPVLGSLSSSAPSMEKEHEKKRPRSLSASLGRYLPPVRQETTTSATPTKREVVEENKNIKPRRQSLLSRIRLGAQRAQSRPKQQASKESMQPDVDKRYIASITQIQKDFISVNAVLKVPEFAQLGLLINELSKAITAGSYQNAEKAAFLLNKKVNEQLPDPDDFKIFKARVKELSQLLKVAATEKEGDNIIQKPPRGRG
jgi:hypothetical protein